MNDDNDNIGVKISNGVYWRCKDGPCKQPSKCMQAEHCLIDYELSYAVTDD